MIEHNDILLFYRRLISQVFFKLLVSGCTCRGAILLVVNICAEHYSRTCNNWYRFVKELYSLTDNVYLPCY